MLNSYQPTNWSHVAQIPPPIEDVWFFQYENTFEIYSDRDFDNYLMTWLGPIRTSCAQSAEVLAANRHKFYEWCEAHNLRPHFA